MRTRFCLLKTSSRTLTFAISILVVGIASYVIAPRTTLAAESTTSESLRRDILAMDARLSAAYADCHTRKFRDLFERNSELFFAERGRLHGVAKHVDDLRRGNCAMRRQTSPSKQSIEALPGHNGAIDGAIQIGEQAFCAKDAEACHGVTTKFIAIWRRTEEGWKIAHLVRYDYTAMR
jgi:hypothetical protein